MQISFIRVNDVCIKSFFFFEKYRVKIMKHDQSKKKHDYQFHNMDNSLTLKITCKTPPIRDYETARFIIKEKKMSTRKY